MDGTIDVGRIMEALGTDDAELAGKVLALCMASFSDGVQDAADVATARVMYWLREHGYPVEMAARLQRHLGSDMSPREQRACDDLLARAVERRDEMRAADTN